MEEMLCHVTVKDILLNYFSEDENNYFLLLSLDTKAIVYILKVVDNNIDEDFINLIKEMLPRGLKIFGFLYLLQKYEANVVDEVSFTNYSRIKRLINPEYGNLGDKFIAINVSYKNMHKFNESTEKEFLEISGRLFEYVANKDSIKLIKDKIQSMSFIDLSDYIKKDYIQLSCFYRPIITITKEKITSSINLREEKQNYGFTIKDTNIFCKSIEIGKTKEKEDFLEEYKRKLESINKLRKLDVEFSLNCSKTLEDNYKENNSSSMTICKEFENDKEREVCIKVLEINIVGIFCKNNEIDYLLDIIQIFFEYSVSKFRDCIIRNRLSQLIHRVHTLELTDQIPIPFLIPYEVEEDVDLDYELDDSSYWVQRAKYHEILNINCTCPKIKIHQISKLKRDMGGNNSQKLLKNIHRLVKSEVENCTVVQGDYNFYHLYLDKVNDKKWGNNHRALQTLLSWLYLNGYSSHTPPNIFEIHELLIYLGLKPLDSSLDEKRLSLENVGYCLSYFVDSDIEIITCNNIFSLRDKRKIIENHMKESNTPILLSSEIRTFTLLGISSTIHSDRYLVLNHDYTGEDNFISITKSGCCNWYPLEDLFFEDEVVDIMFITLSEEI